MLHLYALNLKNGSVYMIFIMLYKHLRQSKGQSIMDNREPMTTLDTQHTGRRPKKINTTGREHR